MVRVESFTTLAKLGSGTEEYFTFVLISRVYSVKTPSTSSFLAKKPEIKISFNIMKD
jgi:hypothetical protein